MKTVYLMRHSEPLKPRIINYNDSLQLQNEKWVLTKNGENIAKKKSRKLGKFDLVIASNYTRAICTAKYFAKDDIYIEEDFGERRFGIKKWEELPKDFYEKQFTDFNYKIGDGESLNEVIKREWKALKKVLNKMTNEKVLIVGHATATMALLTKWCEVGTNEYKFNNKVFFNGKWGLCETFKLDFDDNNNLLNIKNIK